METPENHSPDTPPPPAPAAPAAHAPAAAPQAPAKKPFLGGDPMRKSAFFAAFLSLFPGAGNVYNGLYLRGVTFFLLAAGAIYMAATRGEIWGFVIAFIWIFNVLDAWRQANLINYGYTTDLGTGEQPRTAPRGTGGIVGGAALLLVGLVAAMEMYLEIDVDWIFELWPVILMLLGAWFIWSSIQAKRESDSAEADSLEV